jgi:hypothetical protein
VVGRALLDTPLWITVAAIAALGGWSALLAQRGIAVFHDGVRPVVPEVLGGRLTRGAVAATAFGLSTGFIVGFGVPLAIAGGIVMVYLVLLPADVIGLRAERGWQAVIGGALWGAGIALAMRAVLALADVAPVDFVAPLGALFAPVQYALVAVPPLAVGFQHGVRAGAMAVLISALVVLVVGLNGSVGPFSPVSAGLAVGLILLVSLALLRERGRAADRQGYGDAVAARQLENLGRLRRNIPWLAVQGALIAVACNVGIFAGSEADFAFLAQGRMTDAAVADVVRAFAFLPMVATSTLSTGVAQSVGGLLVYPVGFLAPSPLVAVFAGGAVVSIELALMGRTDDFLVRHPALREAAEHVRGALARVLEVAFLAGSVIAADRLIPGGVGILLVVALYVLNEVAGLRVYRLAAGPLAAVAVGLIANVLALLGVSPRLPL